MFVCFHFHSLNAFEHVFVYLCVVVVVFGCVSCVYILEISDVLVLSPVYEIALFARQWSEAVVVTPVFVLVRVLVDWLGLEWWAVVALVERPPQLVNQLTLAVANFGWHFDVEFVVAVTH